jgi:hypothetical protein
MNHEAIYRSHPNVVTIDSVKGAFDANGNQIELDQTLVDAAAAETCSRTRRYPIPTQPPT